MRLPVVYPEGSLTCPDGTSLMTNTPSNVLRMATDNNTIRDNARILSKKRYWKPLKGLEVAFEYTFDKTWSNQNVNKASIDYTTVETGKNTDCHYWLLWRRLTKVLIIMPSTCMLIIDIHGMTRITCH